MPSVYNKKARGIPTDAVYVGRPTKWGNPYSHLDGGMAKYRVATREEAVAKYEEHLLSSPELMEALPELAGKDLVCWCAPLACHADVLMRHANPTTRHRIMITGHRDMTPAQQASAVQQLTALFNERRASHGDISVLIGMAKGADQLAARVCIDLGVPWTAAIPHQDYCKHYKLDQQVFDDLVAQAAKVIYVVNKPGPFNWRWNFERNEYMIHWAAEVFAITYLNKDPNNPQVTKNKRPRGGTAHALQRALQAGRHVEYVHI